MTGWRIYILLSLVVAALAAGGLYTWRVYEVGQKVGGVETADRIIREQRDAVDAMAAARERVRACYAGGGLWDRASGQCRAAVQGAGK
ncbi:hypothetical protein [Chelatococcus sp. XZ-Ab1]|uniref:hypothetical protein n=1 Tax=Chelatococcus sp. XZ-Ab1 TaxID=3034027 RepID=UPI0023E433C0|nr:hypothetical protein [Chelatococcus sp. XZ-Ab1]